MAVEFLRHDPPPEIINSKLTFIAFIPIIATPAHYNSAVHLSFSAPLPHLLEERP
jgi:hypothetical protein